MVQLHCGCVRNALYVNLSYVHAGIAGQRSCRGQVVAAQHCGNDSVTIHFPDHRSVHKVDESVLIGCNPWRAETDSQGNRKGEDTRESLDTTQNNLETF